MRTSLVLAMVVSLFAPPIARANDPPNPKDVRIVQACLKSRKPGSVSWDACIESAYKPCIGPNENAKPPSDVTGCLRREKLVWDQMLNDAFRKLRDGLDDSQRTKLIDMQRSWIETRDKTCAFYYDYFGGSMANPMIAS